jgi:hypothetical protein
VLFPAARRALPEGDPLTLHIEEDHQAVNDMVAVLDGSSAALGPVDRLLAAAAGAAEQPPVVRRGERPETSR